MITVKLVTCALRCLKSLANILYNIYSLTAKKTSDLLSLVLCEENPPVTSEFPSQRASNTKDISIYHRRRWFIGDLFTQRGSSALIVFAVFHLDAAGPRAKGLSYQLPEGVAKPASGLGHG